MTEPADEPVPDPDEPVPDPAGQVHELLSGLRRRVPEDWEDPDLVRAQPLVVHLEKAAPPARTPTLEAAAAAVVAVLADPRCAPGGVWRDQTTAWLDGRIRKVARRARGAHWTAALGLDPVVIRRYGAEVLALPPYPVAETPKEIDRLQVSGTDLIDPPDLESATRAGQPVIWLSPHAAMSAGKAMAQVGHASMLLAAHLGHDDLAGWLGADLPVAVRTASAETWARLCAGPDDDRERYAATGTVLVRDAGFTEVAPGTVTAIACRPGRSG